MQKIKSYIPAISRFLTDFFIPRVTEIELAALLFSLFVACWFHFATNIAFYIGYGDIVKKSSGDPLIVSFIIFPATIIFGLLISGLFGNEKLPNFYKSIIMTLYYLGFFYVMTFALLHSFSNEAGSIKSFENIILVIQLLRYSVLITIMDRFNSKFLANRLSNIQINARNFWILLLFSGSIGALVFFRYDDFSIKVALIYTYTLFAYYAIENLFLKNRTPS